MASFPWTRGPDFSGEESGVADLVRVPIILMVETLAGFVPGLAKPWLDAFRTYPLSVSWWLVIIIVLFWWGRVLDRRIHDRAQAEWDSRWRERRLRWLRASIKARIAWVAVAIALLAIPTSLSLKHAVGPSDWEHRLDLIVAHPPCRVEPCEPPSKSEKSGKMLRSTGPRGKRGPRLALRPLVF